MGTTAIKLKYDTRSGNYSIGLGIFHLEGILQSESNSFRVSMEEIYNIGFDVTVEKGAFFEKFQGKEFDLGNADRDDLYDVVKDVYSLF